MDSDIREMYGLYRECFPRLPVTEENFFRIFLSENTEGIFRRENGRIIACAILRGENLVLLCVARDHRRRGIGTELLRECEGRIRAAKGKTLCLGGGRPCLFHGVPEEDPGAVAFFRKKGYEGPSTENLLLKLRTLPARGPAIPPCPGDVEFCYGAGEDTASLVCAVRQVFPEMEQTFLGRTAGVLLAKRGKTVVGFAFVSASGAVFSPDGEKTGSISFVGVIPEQRNRGIGRRLVAEGAALLKEQGCDAVEIRNAENSRWFAPNGFVPYVKMWAGKKSL